MTTLMPQEKTDHLLSELGDIALREEPDDIPPEFVLQKYKHDAIFNGIS